MMVINNKDVGRLLTRWSQNIEFAAERIDEMWYNQRRNNLIIRQTLEHGWTSIYSKKIQ